MAIDELLDLVDREDSVIGNRLRSEVYAEGMTNFRVVNAFVINSKGQLWIPRRSADKRIFPLCLDMSMGGHVESGETYDEAFKREVAEELNFNVEKISYKLLEHLTPHENGVSAFMKVYEIQSEEVSNYNKRDFIEYFWLTPEELLDRLREGDSSKEDLPKLVKRFYVTYAKTV